VVATAIEAAGHSLYPGFIEELATFLPGKATRATASAALEEYGSSILPLLSGLVSHRKISIESCRFIPHVIKCFESQEAIRHLFHLLGDGDLSIRLEVVRALSDLRRSKPKLKFNRDKVVAVILEECKLYHQTLSAMHTQIIILYRNRKRSGKDISELEKDARGSLLELLERRLDAGLERIFKLLGLKFPQHDVQIAYEGLLSKKHEAQANAIEFLDNMLSGDLKRRLLPIIEESSLDTTSEEVLQKIMHRIPTERECFALLLNGNDYRVKLAVLYLIKQQGDSGFISLVEEVGSGDDLKIRNFAREVLTELRSAD
jgi:AAA family ATP:ADP antiporter